MTNNVLARKNTRQEKLTVELLTYSGGDNNNDDNNNRRHSKQKHHQQQVRLKAVEVRVNAAAAIMVTRGLNRKSQQPRRANRPTNVVFGAKKRK